MQVTAAAQLSWHHHRIGPFHQGAFGDLLIGVVEKSGALDRLQRLVPGWLSQVPLSRKRLGPRPDHCHVVVATVQAHHGANCDSVSFVVGDLDVAPDTNPVAEHEIVDRMVASAARAGFADESFANVYGRMVPL